MQAVPFTQDIHSARSHILQRDTSEPLKTECRVHCLQRLVAILLPNDARDLDLAGSDVLDRDPCVAECAEHSARDSDVRLHARADHRHFR